MNIKVAAFTVSEKSSNTSYIIIAFSHLFNEASEVLTEPNEKLLFNLHAIYSKNASKRHVH